MKFRRKSDPEQPTAPSDAAETGAAGPDPAAPGAAAAQGGRRGPFDVSEVDDGVERVDVGSLLVAPSPGRELRLQVNEQTGQVAAVLLAGPDGAMELQVFSAPRNGDLWTEVRPQIASDIAQRGGTATEREGRFGTELQCQVPVKRPDGSTSMQPSRIIGVNGARWMLRASLLGRPAIDPDTGGEWEDALEMVAVRRGDQAMPVGRPLPFTLPENARKAT